MLCLSIFYGQIILLDSYISIGFPKQIAIKEFDALLVCFVILVLACELYRNSTLELLNRYNDENDEDFLPMCIKQLKIGIIGSIFCTIILRLNSFWPASNFWINYIIIHIFQLIALLFFTRCFHEHSRFCDLPYRTHWKLYLTFFIISASAGFFFKPYFIDDDKMRDNWFSDTFRFGLFALFIIDFYVLSTGEITKLRPAVGVRRSTLATNEE